MKWKFWKRKPKDRIKRRCALCGLELEIDTKIEGCGTNEDGHYFTRINIYPENVVEFILVRSISYEWWLCDNCCEDTAPDLAESNPFSV